MIEAQATVENAAPPKADPAAVEGGAVPALVARPIRLTMIDAAVPEWSLAPAVPVVNVYLESDHVAHAWTAAEWLAAAQHAELLNLTFVCGPPFDAGADAASIVAQLDRSPLGAIPKGVTVTIDVEHYDASAAWRAGYVPLLAGHFLRDYHVLTYCSATDRGKFGGSVWLGDWTGSPHDIPGADVVQWDGGPGRAWDTSAVFADLPFWNPHATHGGPSPMFPGFAIAPNTEDGYAQCDASGHVYCYGGAEYHGGVDFHLNAPITGMAYTRTGHGYWLHSAGDGAVYAFGDAKYHGHAPKPA